MRRLVFFSLFFLACLTLTLIQTGFIAALGAPFTAVNLPLFFTLFAISIFDERYAFLLFGISATVVGLISSAYLFGPLCIGFLMLIMLSELHERFFTNRTYYSVLILGCIGLIINTFLLAVWTNVSRFLSGNESFYLRIPAFTDIVVSVFVFLVLITGCYGITVLVSKRIRSYFIVSGRL